MDIAGFLARYPSSVLAFLACTTGITYPISITYRIIRRQNIAALYTEEPRFSALGKLCAAYRQPRQFQFTIYLVASLMRSCFISFGHAHGLIQVLGLVVVELLLFGTLSVFRPGHTRGSDVQSLLLSIVRIVTIAALIPFVSDPIGLDPIPCIICIVMADLQQPCPLISVHPFRCPFPLVDYCPFLG